MSDSFQPPIMLLFLHITQNTPTVQKQLSKIYKKNSLQTDNEHNMFFFLSVAKQQFLK